MAERRRYLKFASEDSIKLLQLIKEHKHIILNKFTDVVTSVAKSRAWAQIVTTFNATALTYRTKLSLIKHWDRLKRETKVYYKNKLRNSLLHENGAIIVKNARIFEMAGSLIGIDKDPAWSKNDSAPGLPFTSSSIRNNDVQFNDIEATAPAPSRSKSTPDLPLRASSISDSVQVEPVEVPASTETSFSEVIYVEEDSSPEITDEDITFEEGPDITQVANSPESHNVTITSVWSERPIPSQLDKRSDTMDALCSDCKERNKNKKDIEHLKYMLLQEELDTKIKLHNLQLQAARKDLVIKDLEIHTKTELLSQLSKGGIKLPDLLRITQNSISMNSQLNIN